MTAHGIISALIIGLIIGALGRLVVPGRQSMPIWLTMLIGVVAALVGSLVARAFGVQNTPGVDWIELFNPNAVEVDLADLAERAARPVGRAARGERDHHRLVERLRRLADEARAPRVERHRGEDGQAVRHTVVAEDDAGRVAGDLDVLGHLAAAEVDRIVGLGRQQDLAELVACGLGQARQRQAQLAHAIGR